MNFLSMFLKHPGVLVICLAAVIILLSCWYFYRKRKINREIVKAKKNEPIDPLQHLADQLDISLHRVKYTLGIPLISECNAGTCLDAQKAFESSVSNSEEEFVALRQWIELTDDLDIFVLIEGHIADFPHIQDLFYKKWDTAAVRVIKNMSVWSRADLFELWEKVPACMKAEAELTKRLSIFYVKKDTVQHPELPLFSCSSIDIG